MLINENTIKRAKKTLKKVFNDFCAFLSICSLSFENGHFHEKNLFFLEMEMNCGFFWHAKNLAHLKIRL
jgi:hypothetical protein